MLKFIKLLILLAIIIIVIAIIYYYFKHTIVAQSIQNEKNNNSSAPFLLKNNLENLNIIKENVDITKKETILFKEIEHKNLKNRETLPLLKNNKGIIISYDQNMIKTKNIGDMLKFRMLEYGLNRSGEIIDIEKIDDDILRLTGKFDQGISEQNFFTIVQSKKDQYTIIQIYSDKGNYVAEIINGEGIIQRMDQGIHNADGLIF